MRILRPLVMLCVHTFLNGPDPLFEPLFRYITGDLAEDFYADNQDRSLKLAIVVIDELTALCSDTLCIHGCP